jgi:hypothetical protein
MKIRHLAIAILFLFSTGCYCHLYAGGSDSIWFAGQAIRIGSSKTQFFSRLATNYKLDKMADSDQWMVAEKEPPNRFVGIILFENEKVTFVNKDWGSYGEECIEAFEMIHRALSNISEQKNTAVVMKVGETNEPQGSIKEISLQFGDKRFLISIFNVLGHPKRIGLSEMLQK